MLSLNTVLPANTLGEIYIPKLALSNVVVTESGTTVWKNGAFVPGTDGITTAEDNGQDIVFQAGSGSYAFELTGSEGLLLCSTVIPEVKIILIFFSFLAQYDHIDMS